MWYILNYIPPRGKRRNGVRALVEPYGLELFAPTFTQLSSSDGAPVKKSERPLLYHYIFVRGDEKAVKDLCAEGDGFSYVIDHAGPSRHLTVSDETVEHFRIIARYYAGKLPCYPLEGINLEEGDKVQIMSGPCVGVTGVYISRKGWKRGNILVAVDSNSAVVVYNVKADYVRILEYARDTHRVYDQLDFFQAKVTAAPDVPDLNDLAAATVFARRMEVVKIGHPKLDARLQLLLFTAYSILGDRGKAREAMERYRKLEHYVTNPVTQARHEKLIEKYSHSLT